MKEINKYLITILLILVGLLLVLLISLSVQDTESILKDYAVPIIQVLAPFIAAYAIIKQSNKNHLNSISQLREKYKLDKTVEYVSGITQRIEKVHDALVTCSSFLRISISQKKLSRDGLANFIKEYEKHMDNNTVCGNSLVELLTFIQYEEVIYPKLDIFRIALCELGRLRLEKHNNINAHLFNHPAHINEETLYKLYNEYIENGEKITVILEDLSIDIQNNLLCDIFENKVELRKPGEEGRLVLSTNVDYEETKRMLKYKNIVDKI